MITTAQEIKETLKRLGIQNVTVEIKDNPDAVTDYKARLLTKLQELSVPLGLRLHAKVRRIVEEL